MAKLEATSIKKPKGKKRKHANTETEDEIANKSVILGTKIEEDEPMQTSSECDRESKKKSKKRKNKEKGEVVEKRSKGQKSDADDGADNESHVESNDFREPTLEEIKESEKPENKLAVVTGRQKKKQKHQQLLEVHKSQSSEKESQRNAQYLHKWKHERDSWKFEKLRQISIQHTMFESDKLDANVWPIALEYLAGSKGFAKDKIIKLANDAIEEVDRTCEQQETEQQRENILNSVKYQRARDLLQTFD